MSQLMSQLQIGWHRSMACKPLKMAEKEGLVRLRLIAKRSLSVPRLQSRLLLSSNKFSSLFRLRRMVSWAAPNGGKERLVRLRLIAKRSPSAHHLQSRLLLSSNQFSFLVSAKLSDVLGCAQWRRRRDSNPRYPFEYN